MHASSDLWDPLLEPYRARDWNDCIRQARALVDADPFALLPRLVLASLHVKADSPRLAQLQYEKLLPVAVGKGDLFRAIAVQRHLDELSPESRVPGRFAAMHRWFQMVGLPHAVSTRLEREGGISPSMLLRLDHDRFDELAESLTLETFDLAPREIEVEGGTLWVVLYGRLRWSIIPPEGASEERLATEGALVWVDPACFDRARVRFQPELPTECLRFDAELLRELPANLPGADEAGLPIPEERRAWSGPLGRGATAETASGPAETRLDDAMVAPGSEPAGTSRVDPNGAAPAGDPADRREQMRIAVDYGSRIALLGLPGIQLEPITGRLIDLSQSGFGMRLAKDELRQSIAALGNAVIAIDLELPGQHAELRLAGRVRWIHFGEGDDSLRLGVEFVLLTEPDRALIAETLQRVEQNPGVPSRQVARMVEKAMSAPIADPPDAGSDSKSRPDSAA